MAQSIPLNGWSQRYSTIVQTVTVVALFVGGFWVAVIGPISYRQDRFTHDYLMIREHESFQRRIDDRVAELERVLNARIDYVKTTFDQRFILHHEAINNLTSSIVQNKAYDVKVDNDRAHFTRVESDVKELRDYIGGTYSVKDALAQQQKQLDAIRDKIFAPASQAK